MEGGGVLDLITNFKGEGNDLCIASIIEWPPSKKQKKKLRTRGETGKAFSAAHRNHARMYTCHLGTDTLVTYLTMGLVR